MRLRPFTRADVPAVTTIVVEGNNEDPLNRWLRPHLETQPTSYNRNAFLFVRSAWLEPGRQAFVLVGSLKELEGTDKLTCQYPDSSTVSNPTDEDEVIVGWIWYARHGHSETAKSWNPSKYPPPSASLSLERFLVTVESKITEWIPGYDNCNDSQRRKQFFESEPKVDDVIFAEHWEVEGLMVAKKYWRRGFAKMLMEWGFEQAREEDVPLLVKSSPMGGPMYKRYGFRSIGEIGAGKFFNELEFGGEPMQQLVWEPEGSKGAWVERALQKKEKERKKKEEEEAKKKQEDVEKT